MNMGVALPCDLHVITMTVHIPMHTNETLYHTHTCFTPVYVINVVVDLKLESFTNVSTSATINVYNGVLTRCITLCHLSGEEYQI